MGREIRMVPKDWEHPKEYKGRDIGERFKPMFEGIDGAYRQRADEWVKGCIKWTNGDDPDKVNSECEYYWEWDSMPPSPEDYMPDFGDKATHFMLYESTTEGTPDSPAFETLDKLYEYAEVHCTTFASYKATKEEWKNMLERGFVSHTEGNATFC